MNAIALIIFFIKKKKFRASISLDFYLLNILGVGFLEGEEKKKKKAKPSHIFFLKKKKSIIILQFNKIVCLSALTC